jgi:hypothetical protein
MSKRTKNPSNLAKNASKLHQTILELLTSEESPYKSYNIRQEYRVSEVNPTFKSNREKFDLVILDLKICIECHGKQHEEPVTFGGMSKEQANKIFIAQQDRDELKRLAAVEAGWGYLVVWYYEINLELEELSSRILNAIQAKEEDLPVINREKKPIQSIKRKMPQVDKKLNNNRKLKTTNKTFAKRSLPKQKRKIWNGK